VICLCDWYRQGSVIADITVDLSVNNVTDSIISSVIPTFLHNLMSNNNSIEIDGVNYPASVDMVFDSGLPQMNGSLISAGNISACMCYCLFLCLCSTGIMFLHCPSSFLSVP